MSVQQQLSVPLVDPIENERKQRPFLPCLDPRRSTCCERWCNLCFCCLKETDKIKRIMRKFNPITVSAATPGLMQKLVGRAVPAGGQTQCLYTPCEGRPCVYFSIVIDEERVRTVEYTETDNEGRQHRRTRRENYWHEILRHSQVA